MRINRYYKYRESLPVEERDSYQDWKKSYDRPKSTEKNQYVKRIVKCTKKLGPQSMTYIRI